METQLDSAGMISVKTIRDQVSEILFHQGRVVKGESRPVHHR